MNTPLPAWSSQFAPQGIQAIQRTHPIDTISWEGVCEGSTGRGVKVAVIDSGIDGTHPHLHGTVQGYVAVYEKNGSIICDRGPHEDSCGHGTACAGIIRTIAPDCELYSVKVLGKGLVGKGPAFLAGLQWAIEHGMHVCNMSLGTTKKDFFAALHELVDLAYFQNISLIAAANNLPVPSYPSMFAEVISVAAHAENDQDRFYYNPTPPVEFGALGVNVKVPWLKGQSITATGNSFAAPHVTGFVAKILEKFPGSTPFQVKTVLRSLAANPDAQGR